MTGRGLKAPLRAHSQPLPAVLSRLHNTKSLRFSDRSVRPVAEIGDKTASGATAWFPAKGGNGLLLRLLDQSRVNGPGFCRGPWPSWGLRAGVGKGVGGLCRADP